MDLYKEYKRKFLGREEDLGVPAAVRTAYERLDAMPTGSARDAAEWLAAWSEVQSAVSEVVAKAYFETTRNTRDKKAEAEYERLAEDIIPLAEELDEKVKRRLLSFPREWVPEEFSVVRKNAELDVELFRQENLPLITKDIRLQQAYQRVAADWVCEFDGQKRTPQQLKVYLESQDRSLRERAYRAIQDMHLADYDRLNELFDEMLAVRKEIAENAGVRDYVSYQYKNYHRLSYDPEDGARFRDAVATYVVPAVDRIIERRLRKLGIETMRPWDREVDPDGREAPKVYEDAAELKAKTAAVLEKVDPQFREAFLLMDEKGYLDLENREGKAPGAYMNEFAEERTAMIFANAVGTADDFNTLVHESGHAMHGFLTRHLPYSARRTPMEFAEVASMGLELLARPHLDVVYKPDDLERVKVKQLEKTLIFLPFMAMLDAFQEWVYKDPTGSDRKARARFWRGLEDRYRPYLDWTGLDQYREVGWQYNHVFTVPLYYIEYGIAQVGALQIFLRSKKDYRAAVRDYQRALALGNTAELPGLFRATGVKFVMEAPDVLEYVVARTMEELELGS